MRRGPESKSLWDRVPEGAETLALKPYTPPAKSIREILAIQAAPCVTKEPPTHSLQHPFQQEMVIKLFGSHEAFKAEVEASITNDREERLAALEAARMRTESQNKIIYGPDLTEMPSEVPLLPGIPTIIGEQPQAYSAD